MKKKAYYNRLKLQFFLFYFTWNIKHTYTQHMRNTPGDALIVPVLTHYHILTSYLQIFLPPFNNINSIYQWLHTFSASCTTASAEITKMEAEKKTKKGDYSSDIFCITGNHPFSNLSDLCCNLAVVFSMLNTFFTLSLH